MLTVLTIAGDSTGRFKAANFDDKETQWAFLDNQMGKAFDL